LADNRQSINILDKSVAEIIAAGEVIDRPSSVIKEIVENSIDAGASFITVEIKNGGVTFMRITDNGCGISYGDIPLAFLRHATSKVKVKQDLDCIHTMGFRGEALASISAVAKVELMSKEQNHNGGLYRIEGGVELAHEETGCPDGTTIIIRDLFFNTPARLKFLRKDTAEGNSVQNVVDKLILASPEISFRFIRDGETVRISPGTGGLTAAIRSVYGKQFAAGMTEVDFEQNGVKIKGCTSIPVFCKFNRAFQNFYVNNRYVKSFLCSGVLENAYRGSIMTGKFPACILNIGVNPAETDVNVSPSKTEVRFANEKVITNALYFAVKNALINADYVKEAEIAVAMPSPPVISNYKEYKQTKTVVSEPVQNIYGEINQQTEFKYINEESFAVSENTVPLTLEPFETKQTFSVIGELFGTYIICSDEENLILIDKHAAHERLNFNRLKTELVKSSQILAESVIVKLDSVHCSVIAENAGMLSEIGMDVAAGNDFAEVFAMPSILASREIPAVIEEIAGIFEEGAKDANVIFDEILHTIACRTAIKAHDKTELKDLANLAILVKESNDLRFCPHGRPVTVKISKKEIEKNFGRIV
jgi:DNA mismatch repair protein MutL